MPKEEKNEEVLKYTLIEVPTGSALAIETPDKNLISQEQALVEILNIVKDIKARVD